MTMDFPIAGTEKKFAGLEKEMTQVRRRGSLENPGQPHTNVKRDCGIAMKLVMMTGGIGEHREAIATKLTHGIRDDALLLHLYLCVIPIRWLPQLEGDEQMAILNGFRIENIRTVRGISIHDCLNTRTMVIRYNRVWMKKVKQDLRAWFNAIAFHRIHTESELAMLKAE